MPAATKAKSGAHSMSALPEKTDCHEELIPLPRPVPTHFFLEEAKKCCS